MNDTPKDPLIADPPLLSYSALGPRQPEDAEEEEENEGVGAKAVRYVRNVDKVFAFVTGLILGTVLLIWAVVGAVFWIPLMIRALIRFSISLIEAMFEGHKPARAAKVLRDAVSFYRRGFVVAVEVVTKEQVREDEEGPVMPNRLLFELLWAALVWYFIALLFGWIQASPMDLVDWFRSIPWGEHFGDLVDRFRT